MSEFNEWTDPPGGRPWGLLGVCAGSLVLNLVLGVALLTRGAPEAPISIGVADVAAGAVAEAAPALVEPVVVAQVPLETVQLQFPVEGPLSVSFAKHAPQRGDQVALVYARLFAFDLDLRKLAKGDEVKVSYGRDERDIPLIDYASYHGRKGTLTAYRYQASGEAYASWWDETGAERQPRLIDGPIAEYEQVTSLLRDGRGHHGMDFKVREGVVVVSPRAGKVVRADWNWGANGNCVEVQYEDGTLARFLHLSRTDAVVGKRVAKGDPIGLTGNTGHSTAPHLHYELQKGGKVIDPVDYHGTTVRQLPAGDVAAFAGHRKALEARFTTPAGA